MSGRDISFTLNGQVVSARASAAENAVDVVRRLGCHSVRESCGHGVCGCCTLTVDDQVVSGCMLLAPLLDGTSVETLEGAGADAELDQVQRAFLAHWAFQCGYCTPGIIMMVRDLLARIPAPSDDEIRHHLAGNVCRCATYADILAAVRAASRD